MHGRPSTSETRAPASAASRAACRDVDRRRPEEDVGGHAAGGDVGERQRRAQRADVPPEGADRPRNRLGGTGSAVGVRIDVAVLDHDRLARVADGEPAALVAVERPGAAAPLRDVERARRRISDDGDRDLPVLDERGVHAVERDPGREVPGAADRVDEPVGARARSLAAAFLPDHGQIPDGTPNGVLDREVGRGHDVARALQRDLARAHATARDLEPAPRPPRVRRASRAGSRRPGARGETTRRADRL